MSVRTRALRLLAVLGAALMLGLSAGFAWSVADDYMASRVVPEGVTFEEVDLGGLTAEEARSAVTHRVDEMWMQPVDVVYRGQVFELDPGRSLSADVDAIVAAAFEPRAQTTVAERSYRRITRTPVTTEIEPILSVDGGSLEAWVESVASKVDSPSVDATFTIVEGAVVQGSAAPGLATDREAAVKDITQALLGGAQVVSLPVEPVEPQIADEDLGKTIVVDVSQRSLTLYDGMEVEKAYRCAVGTRGFPTPKGSFKIVEKRYRPSWSNPAPNGWGKDMPAYIPPGPSNPLGTRALNLNYPGIRIHGTTKNSSIGTAASHGCMRMHRWDIEDLYERVEVGTRVLIVR